LEIVFSKATILIWRLKMNNAFDYIYMHY
jgi:hypothetical protein